MEWNSKNWVGTGTYALQKTTLRVYEKSMGNSGNKIEICFPEMVEDSYTY